MSNETTRREFLVATGAGLAAGLLSPALSRAFDGPTLRTGAVRTRRNVVSAEAAKDLDSLRRGVAEMKKLIDTRPDDPRGWILQAYIHGDCGGFTKCRHGSWYFAPWHRVYLYYFEQLIQHFSGDAGFALPYWNWSSSHGVPASFYGAGNALDDNISIRSSCPGAPNAGRGRSQNDQFSQSDLDKYVGPQVVGGIQSNPDYASYGGAESGKGQLEATPHNFVHRWVGGLKQSNMVQFFSPLDPIFWMHHCNIDRLYSDWLRRPGHLPPVDAKAWRDKAFNDFYDAAGKPAGDEWTCGITVDSKAMGYVYDDIVALPELLLKRQSAPRRPKVVETMVSAQSRVDAGVLSFTTEASPPVESRVLLNAAALAPRRYAVRLVLSGLKAPAYQETGVRVYLGDGITADSPIHSPGYVGSFTFFNGHGDASGAGSGGHGKHGGQGDVILDATDAYQALYGAEGVPQGRALSVSLVSEMLFEGVERFSSVEELQPAQVRFEILELAD